MMKNEEPSRWVAVRPPPPMGLSHGKGSSRLSSYSQRIPCSERGKPTIITVHRPEFRDSAHQTGRGNPGIVDQRPPDASAHREFSQLVQHSGRVAQDAQAGRFPPGGDLIEGLFRSRWVFPEFGMRGDSIKFHETVQANGPRDRGFRKSADRFPRFRVEGGFALVGMHQQIGIDCNHPWKKGSLAVSIARLIASLETPAQSAPTEASLSLNETGRVSITRSSASITSARKVIFRSASNGRILLNKSSGISMVVLICICITHEPL